MPTIEFTGNHEDLSTERGYQFRFTCERCGDGFMSTYKANTLGVAGSLLRTVGNLFGGLAGNVGNSTYDIQEAIGGPAHDSAFKEAIEEIKPLFRKCRRCGDWMCDTTCWNGNVGMCKQCAPIAEEEEAAIRAEHVRTQVENDLFLEENARMSAKAKQVAANCAHCGEETLGKKFCPNCGEQVVVGPQHCGDCGAKWTPGAKFCGDCGAKA
jgi:hypothetical protein